MIMALVQAGIGIAQGISSYNAGKSAIRTGRRIREAYRDLGAKSGKIYKEMSEKQKEAAKSIKEGQHKQAGMQLEWNKGEIKRALETNLRGALRQYAEAREDMRNEIYNANAKINFSNDIKNVEESSIKTDSKNRLKTEAQINAQVIMERQLDDTNEIGNQAVGQNYQVGLGYNRTIEGVNQNYLNALTSAEMQLIRDNAQLQSFVNQGVAMGQQLVNQGQQQKNQAMQQMVSSAINGAMGAVGGVSGLTSKLSGMGGTIGKFGNLLGQMTGSNGMGLGGDNGLREIAGTFGKSGLAQIPTNLSIRSNMLPIGQAFTKFKGGF